MKSLEFYTSYGMMRHGELVQEASNLHLMRLLREGRGSAAATFVSRLLSGGGRALAELGRRMEAAGRIANGTTAHG